MRQNESKNLVKKSFFVDFFFANFEEIFFIKFHKKNLQKSLKIWHKNLQNYSKKANKNSLENTSNFTH